MITKAETQIKLIIIYILLLFGYIFTHGFYSFTGFILILLSFFLLLFLSFKKSTSTNTLTLFLFFTLMTSLTLTLFLYGGLYQQNKTLIIFSQLLIFFLIPFSFLYLKDYSARFYFFNKQKFIVFLIVAILLRIFMIISSPHPKIDVFDQLRIGSKELLQLKNPYQLTFPKVYENQIPIIYAYLPGSAIILAPFSAIFNDHRVALILADLGSALILFLLLKKQKKNLSGDERMVAEIIPLIYLFNPMSLFVIEQSWLDPLMTFFLFLFFYFYLKKRNSLLAFFLLGIALTIKQTLILIIPSLLGLRLRIPQMVTIFITMAFIIIPFFVWSPKDFIFDVTGAKQNQIYNLAPVKASLNFTGFFYQFIGKDLSVVAHLLVFILFLFIVFTITKKSFLGFLHNYILITFAATLFFTQAFLNYYTFLSSLILFLFAASILPEKPFTTQITS